MAICRFTSMGKTVTQTKNRQKGGGSDSPRDEYIRPGFDKDVLDGVPLDNPRARQAIMNGQRVTVTPDRLVYGIERKDIPHYANPLCADKIESFHKNTFLPTAKQNGWQVGLRNPKVPDDVQKQRKQEIAEAKRRGLPEPVYPVKEDNEYDTIMFSLKGKPGQAGTECDVIGDEDRCRELLVELMLESSTNTRPHEIGRAHV